MIVSRILAGPLPLTLNIYKVYAIHQFAFLPWNFLYTHLDKAGKYLYCLLLFGQFATIDYFQFSNFLSYQ